MLMRRCCPRRRCGDSWVGCRQEQRGESPDRLACGRRKPSRFALPDHVNSAAPSSILSNLRILAHKRRFELAGRGIDEAISCLCVPCLASIKRSDEPRNRDHFNGQPSLGRASSSPPLSPRRDKGDGPFGPSPTSILPLLYWCGTTMLPPVMVGALVTAPPTGKVRSERLAPLESFTCRPS